MSSLARGRLWSKSELWGRFACESRHHVTMGRLGLHLSVQCKSNLLSIMEQLQASNKIQLCPY